MAGAISFGKSGLCFFTGFPVVLAVVMAAVQVVMVVAVIPALGVWEDERLRTTISRGDWLPAVVDGGALPATEVNI